MLLPLVFAVVFVGSGIIGAALSYTIAAILVTFFTGFLCVRSIPDFFGLHTVIDRPFLRDVFSFSLPVFIGSIGSYILSYTDTVVITFFKSLREVAWYQAALPTSQILWIFSSAVGVVLFPLVSEMWAKRETKLLSEGTALLMEFMFILVMPLALIMFAFPEFVLNLLFGPSYVQGAQALQILAVASIFTSLWGVSSIVLSGIGKPKVTTKLVLFAAVFNLVANILLVQHIGIAGVALATLASFIMTFAFSTFFLRKYIDIRIPLVPLLKSTIGGIAMLVIILCLKYILNLNPWVEVFVCLIAGLVFYILFIFLTRTITRSELLLLSKISVPIPKVIVRIVGKLAKS
jgi:O-antigen/teichoic acid export membrane protein